MTQRNQDTQYWQLCCFPIPAMLTVLGLSLSSASIVHVCLLLWLWLARLGRPGTRARCRDVGSMLALCRQLLSEPPNLLSRDFLEDLGLWWISFEPSHLLRSFEDDPPPACLIFPDPDLELHEEQTSPSSMEVRWEEAYDVLDLLSANFFLFTLDDRLSGSDLISLLLSYPPILL